MSLVTIRRTVHGSVYTSPAYQLGFDEASGSVISEASGGPAATLTGAGSRVAGKTGNAILTTTTGQAAAVAPVALGTSAWSTLTVMAWAKISGAGDWIVGFAAGDVTDLFGIAFGSGTIKTWFRHQAGGTVETVPVAHGIPSGSWAHVAMVWSAASFRNRLYVNGVMVTESALAPATVYANMANVYLGAITPFGGAAPGVAVDDFRIINAALTSADLQRWAATSVVTTAGTPIRRIGKRTY